MNIPDNQEVCLFWNEKPIGKIYSTNTMPYPGEKIYTTSWKGVCLEHEIKPTHFSNAILQMMKLADERNLQMVQVKEGYGIDKLYIPPYEE